MRNFPLSRVVGAAALLWVTATPADLSAQRPIESADTSTELPDAHGPWRFFSVIRDARRCVWPLCGGWWVRAVNEDLTRCADGGWAETCYVAALDTSRIGGDLTAFINSRDNLAFGRVKRRNDRVFGKLGELVVSDAWYGANLIGSRTGYGPEWSAVWDNGIRCVTFPCDSIDQAFLNTGATGSLSILDLSSVVLDQEERDLAEWLLANDLLLVAGQNALISNRGPAGDYVALIANQIYLPLEGRGGDAADD